jgi:hypothetical protein
MNIAATAPATIQIGRRRLVGLLVATAIAAATSTAILIDVRTEAPSSRAPTAAPSTVGRWDGKTGSTWRASTGWGWPQEAAPGAAAVRPASDELVAVESRPIVVADAYHGVGTMACRSGAQPVIAADAYHGVGVTVCP